MIIISGESNSNPKWNSAQPKLKSDYELQSNPNVIRTQTQMELPESKLILKFLRMSFPNSSDWVPQTQNQAQLRTRIEFLQHKLSFPNSMMIIGVLWKSEYAAAVITWSLRHNLDRTKHSMWPVVSSLVKFWKWWASYTLLRAMWGTLRSMWSALGIIWNTFFRPVTKKTDGPKSEPFYLSYKDSEPARKIKKSDVWRIGGSTRGGKWPPEWSKKH